MPLIGHCLAGPVIKVYIILFTDEPMSDERDLQVLVGYSSRRKISIFWNQPWLCNEQVFILYFQAGPEFFYACYFPENEKFTRAVAGIVNYFRQNGYPVVMDVMSSNEMVDLGPTRWAEQQIKKAHKILVFLSPGILRLCGAADEDKQSLHQVTWCGLAS